MNVGLEKKPRESSMVLFGMFVFFVHTCPLDFITPFIPMLQKVMMYIYDQNITEG